MSIIKITEFNQFTEEFPEMQHFYPQLSNASDREFMYENFFAPADELEYDPEDLDDYEYQQSLYA